MITVYHILLDMVNDESEGLKKNWENTKVFRVSPSNPQNIIHQEKSDANAKVIKETNRINRIGLIMFPAITAVFNLVYFLLTTGTVSFQ